MSKRNYQGPNFRKILVPLSPNIDAESAINVARALANGGRIVLVGIVGIPEGDSLSSGTPAAQKVRTLQHRYANKDHVRIRERVRVSYTPWSELQNVLDEEQPDLMVLDWHFLVDLPQSPEAVLHHQSCDIALVRGPLPEKISNILLPMRGSSYAEQSLRIALMLSDAYQATITSLHLKPPEMEEEVAPAFRGISKVLDNMPEVEQKILETSDVPTTILQHAHKADLMIMGTIASPDTFIGPITMHVLTESDAPVIAVRGHKSVTFAWDSVHAGQSAISVLVDKWFAENTYSADEFADLDWLLSLKKKQGVTVSLALPALNEEETVGKVIQTVKTALMDNVPLLDEIVLIDSNSTDRTRDIAADLGVPVFIHQDLLPAYGPRRGKGEALWKSLLVTRGDIILWIDTDIVNIDPRFVYGLLGPLLLRERTQFVKGFYRRPLRVGDKMQAGGGGRVTELTARPLLNLFYPELSGIIQPLSGEYGGRRTVLERMPFSSGYGVETSLLIDIFQQSGLSAIAQVDLQNRIHHNQPLTSLSKMSFAIIQTVVRKLEQRYGWHMLEEVNKSMKLIQYDQGRLSLLVEEIAELERPPMIDLPEYLQREIV